MREDNFNRLPRTLAASQERMLQQFDVLNGHEPFCQIRAGLQDGGKTNQLLQSWYKENAGNWRILTHATQRATKWARRCPLDSALRDVEENLAAYLAAAERQGIATFCANVFENQTCYKNIGGITLQGQESQPREWNSRTRRIRHKVHQVNLLRSPTCRISSSGRLGIIGTSILMQLQPYYDHKGTQG